MRWFWYTSQTEEINTTNYRMERNNDKDNSNSSFGWGDIAFLYLNMEHLLIYHKLQMKLSRQKPAQQ